MEGSITMLNGERREKSGGTAQDKSGSAPESHISDDLFRFGIDLPLDQAEDMGLMNTSYTKPDMLPNRRFLPISTDSPQRRVEYRQRLRRYS